LTFFFTENAMKRYRIKYTITPQDTPEVIITADTQADAEEAFYGGEVDLLPNDLIFEIASIEEC
jgi:hypothetical protein